MPKVIDLVKRRPVTARPEDSVGDVVRLMAENNIGSVVLVDGAGRPVGIVTERDVVRGLARGAGLQDAVRSIATMGDLVSARADEDIYAALRKMRGRGIRHLVVVDDSGVLVGVISMRDLLEDPALKHLGEKTWWPPED
ncbi:MAG: CBS domain-containing protein [Thermoproteus sp.]